MEILDEPGEGPVSRGQGEGSLTTSEVRVCVNHIHVFCDLILNDLKLGSAYIRLGYQARLPLLERET